jgi:hypothetical protein
MAVTTNPGTAGQKVVNTSGPGTKTVKETIAPSAVGDYEFVMETHFAPYSTLFRFHVYPNAVGASTVGGPTIAAGIYLTEVNDLAGNRFKPAAPGVEIMSLPAQPNQPVGGTGTDGATATTMQVVPSQPPPPSAVPPPPNSVQGSMIKDKGNVDACGTVLQGWDVHDVGRIVDARNGPNAETSFTLDFVDGTEYGGLPLSMHLVESFKDSKGVQMVYDATDAINITPLNPQAN